MKFKRRNSNEMPLNKKSRHLSLSVSNSVLRRPRQPNVLAKPRKRQKIKLKRLQESNVVYRHSTWPLEPRL